MSKRYGKVIDSGQLKKPRLDISTTDEPSKPNKKATIDNDDVWGEDFGEDELEKLDIIVSQACSQEVNVSVANFPGPSRVNRQDTAFPTPSTSTGSFSRLNDIPRTNSNSNLQSRFPCNNQQKPPSFHCERLNQERRPQASQKLSSSEDMRGFTDDDVSMLDFKKNLMGKGNLNSTFQMTQYSNTEESIEGKLRKLTKLEEDYKKLLNDFTSKEGETIFLRQQLRSTQTKADKESIEKAKHIEEQASKFRAEINALYKEKESMKTQFQLQTLQLNNVADRCKILEAGSIKLTHPQPANATDSPRSRSTVTPSRIPSAFKVKTSETSNQTEDVDRELFQLKSTIIYYPFKKMPQAIFKSSVIEKSIVDIENVEKRGKRIVPILEDEETFRIFENPNIVKPKVTMVDNKILSVEFFHSDIAGIIDKTESEINSMEVIVIINKIVATLRELMLNIVSVLQTITTSMNNDDIRAMNDLYFSSFYDMPINHNQTLCDAEEWHDKERGIEARRALGVLCYIAEESDYLCEYIAGKCELNIQDDEAYKKYSKQMIRYSEWSSNKKHKYEVLQIILQLVTALSYVRRAHQFTGLNCAISKILGIVQNKVGFTNQGMTYIANIFKEMVFSRPLPRCLIFMTEMMIELSQSQIFINHLIDQPNKTVVGLWENMVTFADDACVLAIYIEQLKKFRFDEISMINMTHALISFADIGFRSEVIPWSCETNNDNDCSTELLILVITTLYKCAKIDVELVKKKFIISRKNEKGLQNLNDNFWLRLRNKQFDSLRMGIRFLSYFAKRDPEVIIRSVDVESSFPLFIEYVALVEGLVLHEVEEEALTLIKSTFDFDKRPSSEDETRDGSILFDIMSSFNEKSVPTPSSGKWFNFGSNRDEYRQMTQMFESKLQL